MHKNYIKMEMADKQSNGEKKKYFILLEDTDGIEKKKRFANFGPKETGYKALKGDIFERIHTKSNEIDFEPSFVSIENPDRTIKCIEEKLKPLKGDEYNFLIAVGVKNERMRLLGSNVLKEIMNIQKGDLVAVQIDGGATFIGKVRYIGPVINEMGYYFGINFDVSYPLTFDFYGFLIFKSKYVF